MSWESILKEHSYILSCQVIVFYILSLLVVPAAVLVKVSNLVVGGILLLSLVLVYNLHQLTLIDGLSWNICLLRGCRRSLPIIFSPAIEVNIDGQFSRVCAGLVGRGPLDGGRGLILEV